MKLNFDYFMLTQIFIFISGNYPHIEDVMYKIFHYAHTSPTEQSDFEK